MLCFQWTGKDSNASLSMLSQRETFPSDFKCLYGGRIDFCLFVIAQSLLATKFLYFDFQQPMTILTRRKTGNNDNKGQVFLSTACLSHEKCYLAMNCKTSGCLWSVLQEICVKGKKQDQYRVSLAFSSFWEILSCQRS